MSNDRFLHAVKSITFAAYVVIVVGAFIARWKGVIDARATTDIFGVITVALAVVLILLRRVQR
ncbi:MAG: hypothetical protein P4L57_11520 [Rhizomicrobium sp.]|nr:hypothetical protein [Rhizomicrobium sp.]